MGNNKYNNGKVSNKLAYCKICKKSKNMYFIKWAIANRIFSEVLRSIGPATAREKQQFATIP
jgi:hypothetical protein